MRVREARNAKPHTERHDGFLKHKFAIDRNVYDEMLESQNNACAICGSEDPGYKRGVWSVDHDHETGKVRGLLCNHCNLMLGHARDNTENLRRAIEYINETQRPSRRSTLTQPASLSALVEEHAELSGRS